MTKRNLDESFPKNFLASVSCEVRFPPLLAIHSKIPVLQEKLRVKYPRLEQGFPIRIGSSVPSYSPELSQWAFSTKDTLMTVKISVDRAMLISTDYPGFETFSQGMMQLVDFLYSSTKIDSYTRIGLRYVNDISFETDDDIYDELSKNFVTPLSDELFQDKPFKFESEVRVKRKSNVSVTNRNRFTKEQAKKYSYLIDIDTYVEEDVDKKELSGLLVEMHEIAIEEFHRNITEEFLRILRVNENGSS
jgi:uncharacterized protein (TIGR04255 family)